jgi:hypothetical protein
MAIENSYMDVISSAAISLIPCLYRVVLSWFLLLLAAAGTEFLKHSFQDAIRYNFCLDRLPNLLSEKK